MRYVFGFVFALFALTTAVQAAPAAAPTAATDPSRLPFVKTLVGNGTTRDGFTLQPEMYLEWGHSVILGPGSEIEIVAPDFAIKAWGPTEVEIKKTKQQTNWIELVYGRMISAFVKGSKSAIATRSNVAGVRGTVVYSEETADQVDYTCVCEGDVLHKHKRMPDRRLETKTTHHDEPFKTVGDGYEKAGMYNHTDEDVAAVKALLKK